VAMIWLWIDVQEAAQFYKNAQVKVYQTDHYIAGS